ncbi:signal peptidase I [Polycladomyces sp. WAk]|uniref:Signal peptidase I n=1 Tax=Polycladomyces zharkentensis TaxID=2807616 RepID=A0ABS2WM84_9BACL|nr:signal peptidase I [Polycladomyces sp. WAk]MBN2910682.1 signal peptidase I [Polycladomyces sp. WAk]
MSGEARNAGDWWKAVVTALLLAIVIRLFFFQPYEVQGMSMYPTFHGRELLIVNKWIYSITKPSYGDIVIFHTEEKRDFIKRVIGLPGDEIAIRNGHVYRNGRQLKEPYIDEPTDSDMEPTRVPPGHLFVMGDNRNQSKDSRELGAIDMHDVVGRAEVIVFPFRRFALLSVH